MGKRGESVKPPGALRASGGRESPGAATNRGLTPPARRRRYGLTKMGSVAPAFSVLVVGGRITPKPSAVTS